MPQVTPTLTQLFNAALQAQSVDGSTTYSLGSQYKYVTVQSNNANWIVIGNN